MAARGTERRSARHEQARLDHVRRRDRDRPCGYAGRDARWRDRSADQWARAVSPPRRNAAAGLSGQLHCARESHTVSRRRRHHHASARTRRQPRSPTPDLTGTTRPSAGVSGSGAGRGARDPAGLCQAEARPSSGRAGLVLLEPVEGAARVRRGEHAAMADPERQARTLGPRRADCAL